MPRRADATPMFCDVLKRPTGDCSVLKRSKLKQKVSDRSFGRKLTKNKSRAAKYDHAAKAACKYAKWKVVDITAMKWSVSGEKWKHHPVNLQPLQARAGVFEIIRDVYDYQHALPGDLIVDFANKHVGGGCFGTGFVQEEQMVAQSTDLALRLKKRREFLSSTEVASYSGIYMDVWWNRKAAAEKDRLLMSDIKDRLSGPFNILAVDAPCLKGSRKNTYTKEALDMLARKLYLTFAAFDDMEWRETPRAMYSGLLGGGDFQGNRPLVLLLHLLLHSGERPLFFHVPILSYNGARLEPEVQKRASFMLDILRDKGVRNIGEALTEILHWEVPLSRGDADLLGHEGQR